MCSFCSKQKTAYEMRISDWSSDVCSSDLPGDPLFLAGEDRPVARRFRRGIGLRCFQRRELLFDRELLFVGQVAIDHAEADLRDRAIALETGRASCRERVCQYV